ncbi:hypothetical protein [Clostridium beijerinckii]|uniref:Uncharacterized membrane protein YoaK (UPF0700 family) n=1 Tax=Clostridium beijerinckii TaxID=1520 RepID=A0A9Q5GMX2_CLOBE|nr:hypothetical protein [Clostridium beijerinckii]AQS06664.1 hypothetical protein CLBIJ_41110 [Clostridium beijerinckii]MBA2887802.1 uncharacterized membrane protein YoaK (UPF0700 family) [Clostridium beijerinckii]MBA2901684.1 uncharacterized membrane protein YoaK (UPF0700 family) [Clostridium beijerinckii]MBA2911429.1 uncharacterized membrane protein YoaK (UPF0700 family) [Clostridium beijerinckii]MBA9013709.1 uncharacterized membrane protein YoaK (UPF0700 family) [Clostridium beijerinckii]
MKHTNYPLYDTLVNRNIKESEARATVISILSQINSIGQIIVGPIIGFVAKNTTTSLGIIISGIMIAPVILIYTYINKSRVNYEKKYDSIIQ